MFYSLSSTALLPSPAALHVFGPKIKAKKEVEADGSKTKIEEHGLKSETDAVVADSSSIKMNEDKVKATLELETTMTTGDGAKIALSEC